MAKANLKSALQKLKSAKPISYDDALNNSAVPTPKKPRKKKKAAVPPASAKGAPAPGKKPKLAVMIAVGMKKGNKNG